MTEKQQALLTVAEAFLARGADIQYDQRSMDRVLELTPPAAQAAAPGGGNKPVHPLSGLLRLCLRPVSPGL